jgi:hypothetical protein
LVFAAFDNGDLLVAAEAECGFLEKDALLFGQPDILRDALLHVFSFVRKLVLIL